MRVPGNRFTHIDLIAAHRKLYAVLNMSHPMDG